MSKHRRCRILNLFGPEAPPLAAWPSSRAVLRYIALLAAVLFIKRCVYKPSAECIPYIPNLNRSRLDYCDPKLIH